MSTNKGGRPNTTPEQMAERVERARWYVEGGWKEEGDIVPTVAGLACVLKISRETIYEWARNDDRFSDVHKELMSVQERQLVNGGLAGGFNSAVTKVMMTKHGYTDKVEQDITSSDGSMTPQPAMTITADVAKEIAKKLNDDC